MQDFTKLTPEEKEDLLQRAYDTGYRLEGTFGGCSQVVLGTMEEVTGIGDHATFQAAYGFAAGSGLTASNCCGAVAGSILFVGYLTGRSYENFGGGRIEECHTAVRKVLDHFNEKYGGFRCEQVQTSLMGRPYRLMFPADNDAFNADGGHDDKCTSVCGDAARFLCKMLVDGDLKYSV